jgi:hypothetical protein
MHDTVEKGFVDLDAALNAPQPSADRVAAIVNGVIGKSTTRPFN